MGVMLGYPGFWASGQLYDDGGLPVHIYPFPINQNGQGPCHPNDAVRFICWCGMEPCMGLHDQLGFPVSPRHEICSCCAPGLPCRPDCHVCWGTSAA